MSAVESFEKLDIDQILAKANQKLRMELQIQADDPVLSVLALNEELLKAYTVIMKQALKEAQHEISAATRQEVQEARNLAANMISKTGDVLEKQLINVGTAWEEKFKASATQELAQIQQSGLAAKIGGYCIFGAGILALTYELVKFAFWLTGHKV